MWGSGRAVRRSSVRWPVRILDRTFGITDLDSGLFTLRAHPRLPVEPVGHDLDAYDTVVNGQAVASHAMTLRYRSTSRPAWSARTHERTLASGLAGSLSEGG